MPIQDAFNKLSSYGVPKRPNHKYAGFYRRQKRQFWTSTKEQQRF